MRVVVAISIAVLLASASLILAPPAQAIPAFSRQFGQSCGACHTAIPKLNQAGEEFRLSGYTRYEGGAAVDKVPPIRIGKMSLPGTIPVSVVGTIGFDGAKINERQREPDFREFIFEPSSFNLEEIEILAAAPLNKYVSFFVDFALAGTELEDHRFNLHGPEAPSIATITFNNLFIDDMVNLRLGAYELPVGFSPEHRRLSIAPYQIYEATAQSLLGLKGPAQTGISDDAQIFNLAQNQLLAEFYGTAYSERLGVSNMYIRYHLGTSNDSNVNGDNNGSKSVFGRLAVTFMNQTLGFFGISSPNTLDSERQAGFPGAHNSVVQLGPDLYLRFLDERLTFAFQHLWARDSDPTGVGTPFRWQGGFAEVNYMFKTPLGQLVPLGRFDYVLTDKFDNTAEALANPLAPSPVVTKPRIFSWTIGLQFLPWENIKISPEFTYRETTERLSKTESTAEHDRIREFLYSLQVKIAF